MSAGAAGSSEQPGPGVRLVQRTSAVFGVLAVFVAACGSGPESLADDCTDCAIRLEYVATLGEGTGDGALDDQIAFVARDGRGRFIVTSHTEALPYLYREGGSYIGRLGSEGEGPGQFVRAASVHANEDSLYVLDRSQGRIQVFDGDLGFVRTISGVVPYHDVVSLARGRFAVNVMPYSEPPIRIYSAAGQVRASLGEESRGDPSYLHMHQPRALAASRSGGFWSIKRFYRPMLREWSAGGELLRELAVDVAWYEPYEQVRELTPDEEPQARITGLYADDSARIWVVGVSGDARWKEGFGEARSGEGGITYHSITDVNLVYDTRVSILDGTDGSVLFERRFDRVLLGIGGPLLIERRPDELGFVSLDVYRIVLDPSAEASS